MLYIVYIVVTKSVYDLSDCVYTYTDEHKLTSVIVQDYAHMYFSTKYICIEVHTLYYCIMRVCTSALNILYTHILSID